MAALSVLTLIAIWGAGVDYFYRKHGGVRHTKSEIRNLLIAFALVAVTAVTFTIWGSSEGAGYFTGMMAQIMFILWQFRRWRTRKKYPLPKNA